jgi:hypothetical protein
MQSIKRLFYPRSHEQTTRASPCRATAPSRSPTSCRRSTVGLYRDVVSRRRRLDPRRLRSPLSPDSSARTKLSRQISQHATSTPDGASPVPWPATARGEREREM